MEHHSRLSYALGADNPRYTIIEVYKWVIYLLIFETLPSVED